MTATRIIVCHNQQPRDSGYRPGDRLVPVYSRLLPPEWSSCHADLLAESLFWAFRAAEPSERASLEGEDMMLNTAYRNRRLRPFVRGDVLVIGGRAFACGPYGRAVPLDRDSLNLPATPSARARRVKEGQRV